MTPKQKAKKLIETFGLEYALKAAKEVFCEVDDLPKIPYNQRRSWYWSEVCDELAKC